MVYYTQHNLDKLQRVQNSAARLIVGTFKDAAFSVAAADLRNGLPTIIRAIHDEDICKSAIKTH